MQWIDPPTAITLSSGTNLYDVSGAPWNVPTDASFCILRFANTTSGVSPAYNHANQMEALCESDSVVSNAGILPTEIHTVLAPVHLYDHGSGPVATLKIYSEHNSGVNGTVCYFDGHLTTTEATSFSTKVACCTDITVPHSTAGAWQTTSLAGTVPSTAVFAIIEGFTDLNGAETTLIRPTGSTIHSGAPSSPYYNMDSQVRHHFIVPLNGSQQFDIFTKDTVAGQTQNWYCKGYIKAGTVNSLPESSDTETLSAGTWNTFTANGGGTNGGVIVLLTHNQGSYEYHWRKGGSTWTASGYNQHYTVQTALVATDSSKQYDIWSDVASSGLQKISVLGYVEQVIGVEEEAEADDAILSSIHTPPDPETDDATIDDSTYYGETVTDSATESGTIDDTTTAAREQAPYMDMQHATISDSAIYEKTGPGTGSGSYGVYTGIGYGNTSVENDPSVYPNYTVSATVVSDMEGAGEDLTYPFYTADGDGVSEIGGSSSSSSDIGTIYDPYLFTGTLAVGAVGTASATYPSYTGEGEYLTGDGSGEYPEYTVSATTPGSAASGATDFAGTADVEYRKYTVSATTKSEIFGQGEISYPFRYTGLGEGYGSAEAASVGSVYPVYGGLGTGATGNIGTALPGPAGATPIGRRDPAVNEYPYYTIEATARYEYISATGSAYYPLYLVDAIGITDVVDVYTGRLITGDGEAILDGDGNFIQVYPAIPPSHEVMFTAMNLEKKAVTEYHNFSFNSMTNNGDQLMGANHNGIYIVDSTSSDDDGSDIDSNIEKLGVDYGAGMRKRVTDAYLHLHSSGSYVVGPVADGSQVPITVADTDTLEHTRKVDFPKGLIGRSLGWIYRNTNGANFEIEEIELILEVGSRRAKRYRG